MSVWPSVEGAIPLADGGVYCTIGGRTALDIAREVCGNAAATIAVGACAWVEDSWPPAPIRRRCGRAVCSKPALSGEVIRSTESAGCYRCPLESGHDCRFHSCVSRSFHRSHASAAK
jgi:hypothetical protein